MTNSFSLNSTYPLHLNKKKCLIKSETPEMEIRVCVNRTCGKQGSRETFEILSAIAPPQVSVTTSGCLGKCGSGPNLVILPQVVFVSHCATPARTAQVLATCLGDTDDPSNNLAALALRKRAEEKMEKGEFSEAEDLLSQAIDLKPSGGLHIIYKIRSSVQLAIGNSFGALEDAKKALTLAPKYSQGYLCEGDAFMALENFVAAENSYSTALDLDPSIRRSKSFRAQITKLQAKLTAAELAS
ncbi:hypothetical protein ACHQM5_005291 [Ranunculus cassubicifolius]